MANEAQAYRRWLPGADIADLNNSKAAVPLPSWLSIGGPATLLIDFYSNTNFRGQPIVEPTDSAGETMEKVVDMVMKFALPNLPVPGLGSALRAVGADIDQGNLDPFAWASLERTWSGARSFTGKQEDMKVTLPNVLGVKLDSRPLNEELAILGFEFDRKERDLKSKINQIARRGARGNIRQEEMRRRIQAEVVKLQELGRKMGEKTAPPAP